MSGQCWEVVGGSDKGGIVVRAGKELTSPQLPERLGTGAVVQAEEVIGERLHYKVLSGTGPPTGWVSIRLKDKELLKPTATPTGGAGGGPAEEPPNPYAGWRARLGFERIANVRDVADMEPPVACEGGRLRRGLLFRGGQWACATDSDIAKLQDELDIRTYIDLREGLDFEGADAPVYDIYPPGPAARHKDTPMPEPGQRRRLHCPFTKDLRVRPFTKEERTKQVPPEDRKAQTSWWFQRVLRDEMEGKVRLDLATRLSYVNRTILFVNYDEVLKAMLACTDRRNFPMLFGCVAGKDRTGLMSCLILGALGVSEDTIMADYLATNDSSAHINACAQAATFFWYKQLEKEAPKKWEQLLKTGVVNPMHFLDYGPAPAGSADPFVRGKEANAKLFFLGEVPEAKPAAAGDAAEQGGNAASDAANIKEAAVYEQTMRYTLKLLKEECGGTLAYLASIGFGAAEVAKLREALVEAGEG